jgi:hypothetical protein
VPLQAHHMRLHRTSTQDSDYLCDLLDQISRPSGARFKRGDDDVLELVRQP